VDAVVRRGVKNYESPPYLQAHPAPHDPVWRRISQVNHGLGMPEGLQVISITLYRFFSAATSFS
jgi:hypothetical protein